MCGASGATPAWPVSATGCRSSGRTRRKRLLLDWFEALAPLCAACGRRLSLRPMEPRAHLDDLNPAQRAAVRFGVPGCGPATARAAAADHRRRRHRQDQHAGAPRGAPGAQRCRSRPHPAAHLHPARGRGDGRAAPERICGQALGSDAGVRRAGSSGPAHSTPSAPGCCATMPTRIGLDPGFTILDRGDAGRPARPGARRAGPGAHRPALPEEGHLPRDLLLRRQRPGAAGRGPARRRFPGAPSGQPS